MYDILSYILSQIVTKYLINVPESVYIYIYIYVYICKNTYACIYELVSESFLC